jgi:vacuolar-type H+-ATPase subunit H
LLFKALQNKTEIFEKEREQWKDEKNKVIRYQKQLQLNYLQMFNKNRMLEAEVEQLTHQ